MPSSRSGPPLTRIRPSAWFQRVRARAAVAAKVALSLSAARLARAPATLTKETPTRAVTTRLRRVSKLA